MSEVLDFSNEAGVDYSSWENLDEAQLNSEINGLIKRINNVAVLLNKMVYDNDYENTARHYENLYTADLGVSGFVRLFYDRNKSTFGEYKSESMAPPWYGNLPAEQKKSFDACHRFFLDAGWLVAPIEAMGRAMMMVPLEPAYKYMRSVLNFSEAGLNENTYDTIDRDMKEVMNLLNTGWDNLESRASRSRRYYQDNPGKVAEQSYRAARIEDYRSELDGYRIRERFIMRSNGTFAVEPAFHADMKIIDKYTLELSTLPNIEDGLNKMLDGFPKIGEQLNEAYANVKSNQFRSLVDALYKLRDTMNEFAQMGLHVFKSYKDKDTEAPYVFLRPLPAYSSMNGRYGLNARTGNAFLDGTDYYNLYRDAAEALSEHCKDFVYNHGLT